MKKRSKQQRPRHCEEAVSKPEVQAVMEPQTSWQWVKRRVVREAVWHTGKAMWEYVKDIDWFESFLG
jgi:hypothetical protein